jgi:hypothetical protein
MSVPILFACRMCTLGQPEAFALAFWIGGVVVIRWLQEQHLPSELRIGPVKRK